MATDCKSRSSQGVEKTVLQNKKMESFGGPPVKEVGTWIIIGQRTHEDSWGIRNWTEQRGEQRGALREKNITLLVIPCLYSLLSTINWDSNDTRVPGLHKPTRTPNTRAHASTLSIVRSSSVSCTCEREGVLSLPPLRLRTPRSRNRGESSTGGEEDTLGYIMPVRQDVHLHILQAWCIST